MRKSRPSKASRNKAKSRAMLKKAANKAVSLRMQGAMRRAAKKLIRQVKRLPKKAK